MLWKRRTTLEALPAQGRGVALVLHVAAGGERPLGGLGLVQGPATRAAA